MRRAGATLHCGVWASHCGGFSCCGAHALGARASVVVAHGLNSCGSRAVERRLSSCGARALLLCGMWDLPRPGIEPVSPALAGRFLTTAPSGNPPHCLLIEILYQMYSPGPGWQNIPADVDYHHGTHSLGKQEKLPQAN